MNDLSALSGKRLLISGINGFLGAHVGVTGVGIGAQVLGVDLPGGSARGKRIRHSLGSDDVLIMEENLSNRTAWRGILEETQPDVVLHLAGVTSRDFTCRDWATSIDANVLTTSSLVEAILALPQGSRPAVAYPGSQMEYGIATMPWTEDTRCRPSSPYGASKLAAAELLLVAERSSVCRACVARFPILFGPAQPATMFIPELITKALAGMNFPMTEGRQRRRFLYVADAATFLLALAARFVNEESLPPLLNMPASEPTSMRDVARATVDCLDRPVELEVGALPSRGHMSPDAWPDDTQARSLGFSCHTSLERGLRQTIRWYQSNPWFAEPEIS